jgi:hypothetical protein
MHGIIYNIKPVLNPFRDNTSVKKQLCGQASRRDATIIIQHLSANILSQWDNQSAVDLLLPIFYPYGIAKLTWILFC